MSSPIMRSAAQILVGNAAVSGIQMLTGLLMARWIAPLEMGVWNTVSLVMVYAPFLTLGVYSGLNRELPFLLGAGRTDEALTIAQTAYAWTWILGAATIPVAAGFSCWYLLLAQPDLGWTIVAVGVSVLFGLLGSYLGTTYRTHTEFGRLSLANALVAFIGLFLMLLVWGFGYRGMLWRAGLSAFLAWAVLFHGRPFPVSPLWNRTAFVGLLKVGAPLFLVGHLVTVFLSLDRTVLIDSKEAIGLFTLASLVGNAVRMIPAAFTMVTFPALAQRYGRDGKARELWWLAAGASAAATAVSCVIGLIGWWALPPFVERFLPAYLGGLLSAQWASFHGVALGFHVFANIFNVVRRQDLYVACLAVGTMAFAAFWYLRGGGGGVEGRVLASSQAMLAGTFAYSMSTMLASGYACVIHDRRVVSN